MKKAQKNSLFGALGAACGLGNAFRFPVLCARYGGAFIIAYVLSLALVCYPLLTAELAFGKQAHPLKNLKLCMGIFCAAAANSALIALYYGVICAKSLSYGLVFAQNCGLEWADFAPWLALMAAVVLAAAFIILRGGNAATSVSGKLSVGLSLITFSYLAVRGAVVGGKNVAALFCNLSPLSGGAVWVDALGQALLGLSLAAGVMPTYARNLPKNFSPSKTAAKIVCANFVGCVCSLLATLSFNVQTVGADGFLIYSNVVYAVARTQTGRRVFGCALFMVLTVVAVHSMCSLAAPAISAFKNRRGLVSFVFCILSAALFPLFTSQNGGALTACDSMACSVNAVIIAFAECLYLASQRHMCRSINKFCRFFIKFVCPPACGALAIFSLCAARFSGFPPLARACAYAALVIVLLCALFPCLTFFRKKLKMKRI